MFIASLLPLGPDLIFWSYRELLQAKRNSAIERSQINPQEEEIQPKEGQDNFEDAHFDNNQSVSRDRGADQT